MKTTTMKAAVCEAYGEPEVLQLRQLAKPSPGAHEILVKVKATAVNSGDVKVRSLKVPALYRFMMRCMIGWNKPRKPVLGTVYAGVVEQCGDAVTEFNIGDEVFGLTGFKFGTFAEYLLVKEKSVLWKKPANASFDEAAAILFGGQTAFYFLNKFGLSRLKQARVLVYGASGAVGTAALQIVTLNGGEVTAVCSDKNAEFVLRLGAREVICYNKQDVKQQGGHYDLIFDAVGKLKRSEFKQLLNPGGQFITVAGPEYAVEKREQLHFLKNIFEKGTYQACIDKVFRLDEIVEAHRYVDSERKKGNVVIRVGG